MLNFDLTKYSEFFKPMGKNESQSYFKCALL